MSSSCLQISKRAACVVANHRRFDGHHSIRDGLVWTVACKHRAERPVLLLQAAPGAAQHPQPHRSTLHAGLDDVTSPPPQPREKASGQACSVAPICMRRAYLYLVDIMQRPFPACKAGELLLHRLHDWRTWTAPTKLRCRCDSGFPLDLRLAPLWYSAASRM